MTALEGAIETCLPVAGIDRNLVIRCWTSGAEELTGLKANDVLGKPCWDVLRLHSPAGDPICSPSCEPAREALLGHPEAGRPIRITTTGKSVLATMMTAAVPCGGEEMIIHVIGRERDRDTPTDRPTLTNRQLQVLALLNEGRTTKQIASDLSLSIHTVRHHIQAILSRLNSRTRLAAVHKARQQGIL